MTQQPDERPEEPTGSSDVEPALDEDAAWAAIVANYGDRPVMGTDAPADRPGKVQERADGWEVEDGREVEERAKRASRDPRPPRNIFDRSFIEATTQRSDELNTRASWDEEGHFVPPEPPPLPVVEPRRKLAWIAMFGGPALMLLGIVLGWTYPTWVSALLVGGFVGGFVYLVATMQRTRPGDWSGDDGAVV